MKKRFLIFSILFLVLFVASCGGSDNGKDTGDVTDSGDSGSTGDNGDSGSAGDGGDSGSTGDTGSDTGVVSETCGNGVIDAGEVCDGGTKDCTLVDSGYTDGVAACKSNCSGWDTTICVGIPVNPVEDPTDPTDTEEDTKNDNSDPREGADVTYIHLNGSTITVDGAHQGDVTVSGATATITASGVFEIDGTLSNGTVSVNVDKAKDSEIVHVVFNGVNITNSSSSPFMVKSAKDVRIFTAKDTQNTLTDGSNYTIPTDDPANTDAAAALYSKSDLLLAGEGTLTVNGNCNDGIGSKDDLDINGGTLVVTAKDDGIRGKDSVVIRNGNITVTSGGDGIKSDNTTKLVLKDVPDDGTVINDAAYEDIKGYIKIKGGSVNVTATNGDGIHAISYVEIQDGTVNITSGGGSVITTSSSGGGWGGGGPGSSAEDKYDGETSLKGIKASIPNDVEGYADLNTNVVYIKIVGGTIKVNSRDDAIHSGGLVYIKGGDIEIASDDDGIHADNELMIMAGTVNVTMSYEGFEAWYITVSGGVTAVYGRDDGWNAAGGTDSSGSSGGGPGDWGGGGPGQGGSGGGGFPGGNGSTGYLTIEGGFHYIKTGTGDVDGIDSNGTMTITGGVIIVECQISGGMGGSFDSDGAANITTQTALGFSKSRSEKGTNYNMNFNSNTIYGNANVAFKPTTSGSYIQSFTGQPSVINDVSGYNVQPFPNGVEVYYKQ